ncbi:MAG: hypothetical protein IJ812_07375 [Schwartzia sp.]|nr:hypothetical protein [Schwartzia sp. (in: firmicutes)]MBR1886213.1 hypothetical protein [Schwartzia sp. (in: firmicutes)]
MARKKKMSIVIGSFSDPANQIWAPNAHAFETAQEAVNYLGSRDAYYEDFAYELKVKKEDLPAALERTDPAIAMEALVRVLQMNPGMAIRTFRTIREAEAFLDLIEQIAEKKEKERGRDARSF